MNAIGQFLLQNGTRIYLVLGLMLFFVFSVIQATYRSVAYPDKAALEHLWQENGLVATSTPYTGVYSVGLFANDTCIFLQTSPKDSDTLQKEILTRKVVSALFPDSIYRKWENSAQLAPYHALAKPNWDPGQGKSSKEVIAEIAPKYDFPQFEELLEEKTRMHLKER